MNVPASNSVTNPSQSVNHFSLEELQQLLFKGKSRLAQIVVGIAEKQQARSPQWTAPTFVIAQSTCPPAPLSHLQKAYSSYVAFCKSVSSPDRTVEPLSIEHWDSLSSTPARKLDLLTWKGTAWTPTERSIQPLKKNAHASLWCAACENYTEQVHPSHPCIAPLGMIVAEMIKTTVAEKIWPALHTLRRDPPKGLHIFEAAPVHPLEHEIVYAERRRSYLKGSYQSTSWKAITHQREVFVDYLAVHRCTHADTRSFTFSTGEAISCCSDCTRFDDARKVMLTQWKVAPPLPYTEQYVQWRNACLSMTPMEAIGVSWCEGELTRLGLTRNAGVLRGLSYQGTSVKVEQINTARERDLFNGGKRVNTVSFAAKDDDGRQGANWFGIGDHNSRDWRGTQMVDDYQSVSATIGACLYCGKELAARKGTKYCLGTDHRQRHWDQRHLQENT